MASKTFSGVAAAVSASVEASGDAMASVFERMRVMTAKMTVVDYCPAVRNIVAPTEGHAAAHEVRAPRVEAPAEAAKDPQPDSHAEANTDADHHADRDRCDEKARVGDHQRSVDHPGIVIRDGHQKRIDRRDCDNAAFHHHRLLRRGHQDVPFLRRETVGLDRIHHVFRLVVIGVAELRRPWGVLRKIIQDRGKRRETLQGRVPIHGVRRGCALLDGHPQIGV